MPLLVHGVLAAGASGHVPTDGLAEAAGRPVALVEEGDLAVLVSETEADEVLPSRANLMAHARVLEALADEVTVAPMQFGVVVPDEPALRADIAERHGQLLEVLERLEGHLELRLRGRYEEDEVVREVIAADPRAARLRGRTSFEDRMALGERIVAGIEARRDVDRERVLQQLAPFVADVAVGDVGEPLDAFALSLLVEQKTMDQFDERIEDLGAELSPAVRLELVGPVPPFSFAGTGAA